MRAAEINGSQRADSVKNENRNDFPGPGQHDSAHRKDMLLVAGLSCGAPLGPSIL
jgi:hypothetical protein